METTQTILDDVENLIKNYVFLLDDIRSKIIELKKKGIEDRRLEDFMDTGLEKLYECYQYKKHLQKEL